MHTPPLFNISYIVEISLTLCAKQLPYSNLSKVGFTLTKKMVLKFSGLLINILTTILRDSVSLPTKKQKYGQQQTVTEMKACKVISAN